ncbi:MAG: DUF4410 domain-containing protein [Geminicoccaceae bacterium]|nr:DUF4410 domain-containing protein [Geminicoccaceae bacterium]
MPNTTTSAWRLGAIGAVALLAACTQSSSQIETTAALPKPQVIVVQDFAVQAGEVQLDPGLSGTIDETIKASTLPPNTAEEAQVGRQVADALAQKLVTEINDLGLNAQRGNTLPDGMSSGLEITGQFVGVDQGNRTERVAIGLGAGRSDVRVRAQVFEVTPSSRTLVDEIEVDAKSGLQPGMAEMMGVGALAGHFVASTVVSGGLQVADESLGTSVVADSDRAAKGIAKQLATFFGEQGWTK